MTFLVAAYAAEAVWSWQGGPMGFLWLATLGLVCGIVVGIWAHWTENRDHG